jgi:type I restriction enzyme S subunit
MLRAMNLNQYSVSAAQPGLSVEIISNIDVPYPPLDEQCAIAAFVDRETAKIDALIAEQEKLIVLLAEKRQVTISHAVTKGLNPDAPMKDSGVTWLGEVPIHWGHARKLLDLVTSHQHSFVNGPFGSDLLTSELVAEGVPIIYIRDINAMGYRRVSEWHVTREKALQLQFCNVQPGDILVAKVGDPPGVAAVYPAGEPQAIVTQDVIRLRLDADKALPRYICWLLNSRYGKTTIEQISVESTRTRVGLGEYKQLRFVVPPLPEQVSIATFLDVECARLDALTAEATRAIALLKERRSSLIAAAVTGQIDVRRT